MSQTSMTGGENKMIVVEVKKTGKVGGRNNIQDRERAANVAGTSLIDHVENIEAELLDNGLKIRVILRLK